jgi:acetate kinase
VRILVVNAGSSSLKIRLLGADDVVEASWDALPATLPEVDVVAHRVVHGGTAFRRAVIVDDDVERQLRELIPLAPLHQPKTLAALDEVRKLLPGAVQVACFDTAFHADIGDAAATYALPRAWITKYGLRRYGFHGLSHAWASHRAAELVPGARRIITCHLGAGASLCAVRDGVSVDTTMGFTPLEGLVMATRSGDVDPGLLMWLAQREPGLADVLDRRSGLTGLAGTGDMRELLARDDVDAQLAVDVYLHRLRKGIGSMAASLGGLDVCVFTGGVGENSPEIRRRAIDGLGFLGLNVDDATNAAVTGDADITASRASARTLVIAAREDLEMVRQAHQLLGTSAAGLPAGALDVPVVGAPD